MDQITLVGVGHRNGGSIEYVGICLGSGCDGQGSGRLVLRYGELTRRRNGSPALFIAAYRPLHGIVKVAGAGNLGRELLRFANRNGGRLRLDGDACDRGNHRDVNRAKHGEIIILGSGFHGERAGLLVLCHCEYTVLGNEGAGAGFVLHTPSHGFINIQADACGLSGERQRSPRRN